VWFQVDLQLPANPAFRFSHIEATAMWFAARTALAFSSPSEGACPQQIRFHQTVKNISVKPLAIIWFMCYTVI
jgi:hypothetical protein